MHLPPLNAVKTFEAAGRVENFSKAAVELNVTPGAVSRQIKNLDQHLGVSLFARVGNEVQITPIGRRYLGEVQEAFSRLDAGTRAISADQEAKPLHIWGSRFFIRLWLLPRLPDFHQRFPDQEVLITTVRPDEPDRDRRGQGKPETFDFLGLTHSCGTNKAGRFELRRQTMRKKWQAKLKEVYATLRKRMHSPVPEQGCYLRAVMRGHINYYGVPGGNRPSVAAFRFRLGWLWWKVLRRRSQRTTVTTERLRRLVEKWIPEPYLSHPYFPRFQRVRPEAGTV